jgi:hypothetical protein
MSKLAEVEQGVREAAQTHAAALTAGMMENIIVPRYSDAYREVFSVLLRDDPEMTLPLSSYTILAWLYLESYCGEMRRRAEEAMHAVQD